MPGYKAAWSGRELRVVDRWFPGSKLCSARGAVAATMPLNVRTRTCEGCGAVHDRNGGPAVDLLAAGSAVSACRADGRPPGDPPGRRSAVKQENPPARVGTVPPKGHGEAKQPR
ncbi:zinc ribbon domain-containing protein [Streptomyces sp. NPDC099050]|uniref:zinc ribbon domain-containing protein n=1 Tax=Streptomyces sp. NPDC099050 TaxID=3366100 RepID=UPI003829DED2